MNAQRVRHIFFYVALKPGNLFLAEVEDRKLCIFKNDEAMECEWALGDMELAVKEFMKVKSELMAPGGGPRGDAAAQAQSN